MSQIAFTLQPSTLFRRLPADAPDVNVMQCAIEALKVQRLSGFLASSTDGNIGVSARYDTQCRLVELFLATDAEVLAISMRPSAAPWLKKKKKPNTTGAARLLEEFLNQDLLRKVALNMDRFVCSLYHDHSLTLSNATDLLDMSKSPSESVQAWLDALGGVDLVERGQVQSLLTSHDSTTAEAKDLAMLAWAAKHVAGVSPVLEKLESATLIDTTVFTAEQLQFIVSIRRDIDIIVAAKPLRTKNEVGKDFSYKKGKLVVQSQRFKTRVMRPSDNQTIEIAFGAMTIGGTTRRVNGKEATIQAKGTIPTNEKITISTIGREAFTAAENYRNHVIHYTLQGNHSLFDNPFARKIWLPSTTPTWPPFPFVVPTSICVIGRELNASQMKAVQAILSTSQKERITLIQGPPGTGKTTVIAAATANIIDSSTVANDIDTVWLLAQSNVAVKNIAEKLISDDFVDFRLVVSKDFHFDWHEHIYPKVQKKLIVSDALSDDPVSTGRMLNGARVILCTLSMLSHPRIGAILGLLPIRTVIVDEASQIEIGYYLPLLQQHQSTLRKLVFVGDDKQLPPYGSNLNTNGMRSMFEVKHLRKKAILLDTQYRMPVPIGEFISGAMYGGLLKSQHSITSLKSCRFVDVANGHEEKFGTSWINIKEVQACVQIAQRLCATGKNYRIITPYDAQRNQLEKGLKAAKIPWEDKCFNVDSFQGNEEDYIIISLVRTKNIGFLKDNRRNNVMLTRCKKQMIICTNRYFLHTEAVKKKTLVGRLVTHFGPSSWRRLAPEDTNGSISLIY